MKRKTLLILLMVGSLVACSDSRRKNQERLPNWEDPTRDAYLVTDPEFNDPDFMDAGFSDPDFADLKFMDLDMDSDDDETFRRSDRYYQSYDSDDDEIFLKVDRKAQFPGGVHNQMLYIRENMEYPEEAKEDGVQGRVLIKFIVRKDGSIDNINVTRSLDPLLDKEAIRLVENMPNWIPAQNQGRIVNSFFTIPILFRLDAE